MAETLFGPHRRCACPQCGFPLRYFADGEPSHPCLVCPNCDHRFREPNSTDISGDVVTCTARRPAAGSVERWRIVVANAHDQRVIKRVVGLPNEQITIRYGDVYVNGVLERKPWSTFRALAIPVHLDRYQPNDARRSKWTAEGEIARREATGRYAVCRSVTSHDGGPPSHAETPDAGRIAQPARGTLRFRAHADASDEPRPKIARILDRYGSNQFGSVRLLPVFDFLIHLRLRTSSAADLTITMDGIQVALSLGDSGEDRCAIHELLPSPAKSPSAATTGGLAAMPARQGIAESQRNSESIFQSRLGNASPLGHPRSEWRDVWCGYLDGMFVVRLDGKLLAEWPIDREARVRQGATDVHLALETAGRVEFQPPSLWRDIHYRMSPLEEGSASWTLGPDEYLLHGDQPTVSRDARQAPDDGIASLEEIEAVVIGRTRDAGTEGEPNRNRNRTLVLRPNTRDPFATRP